MAFIEHMRGYDYIYHTRKYLDYLEEHLDNVRKAFNTLSKICKDMWWVKDDVSWHTLRCEVCYHDISKFSEDEFIQYRRKFFPIKDEIIDIKEFDEAFQNHLINNTHHYQSLKNDLDVVHMVIDWTAMGYKFGDTAQDYYEKNRDNIKLNKRQEQIVLDMFVYMSRED